MTSKSLWMDTEVAPGAEVLDGVHECDVAVIGSGIAGISTAYELSKRRQIRNCHRPRPHLRRHDVAHLRSSCSTMR